MNRWAIWYRKLLIAWAVIGLPSVIVGYGFSGGNFELPLGWDALPWALVVLFLLSPLLLWRWRRAGPSRDF